MCKTLKWLSTLSVVGDSLSNVSFPAWEELEIRSFYHTFITQTMHVSHHSSTLVLASGAVMISLRDIPVLFQASNLFNHIPGIMLFNLKSNCMEATRMIKLKSKESMNIVFVYVLCPNQRWFIDDFRQHLRHIEYMCIHKGLMNQTVVLKMCLPPARLSLDDPSTVQY